MHWDEEQHFGSEKYHIEISGKMQPICAYGNALIIYYRGKVLKLQDKCIQPLITIPQSMSKKIKECHSLSKRLFRIEVRGSILIGNIIYMFFDKKLLSVNMENLSIKILYEVPTEMSMPLNLSEALPKEKWNALFGDYFSNPYHDKVNIYGVNKFGTIDKIFSFPKGTIRHIHNIVPDKKRNGYWILTGDNEELAGIWFAEFGLQHIRPIYVGSSIARTVVGFPLEEGLLFATDSVSSQNGIYILKNKDGLYNVKKITDLNGSCIYGTETKDGYLFSTTVESAEGGGLLNLLSRKHGSGIKSNFVDLIFLDKSLRVSKICSFQKDDLPYKLFQYGAVRFINNQMTIDDLYIYPIAVKKYDHHMLMLSKLG